MTLHRLIAFLAMLSSSALGAVVGPVVGGVAVSTALNATLPDRAAAAPPTADEILQQVQAFYDRTQTIEAVFSQSYTSKLYQRTQSSKGKVIFQKPGRMRWNYAKPKGKLIVSDGKALQIFEPGTSGTPPQLIESAVDQHQLPIAFSFLTGVGRLEKSFDARLLEYKGERYPSGAIIELRPKSKEQRLQRLILYVGTGELRGVVLRVAVIDADGNRNRFGFSKLKFNRGKSDETFRLGKVPRTTQRVQL